MTALVIILISIISLSFLVLSLKIKIETLFLNNKFVFKVYVFGIKLLDNQNKKVATHKENSEKPEKEKLDILKLLIENKEEISKDLSEIFRLVRKKVHSRGFYLNLTFGLKDAADTGMLVGGVWSFIGSVFPVVQSLLFFEDIPTINVNPVFNKYSFLVEYKGDYTLRVIHIIKLGIKLLLKYKKYKGGVNNGTASN